MKLFILVAALFLSFFIADESWGASTRASAAAQANKKVVCSNGGVTITIDVAKKRTFITRKKGSRLVTLPMGRVKKTEVFAFDEQRKSAFTLSNKSKIEVSFSDRSNLGVGYGTLTAGKSGRMYDMGDCVRSLN